MNWYQNTITGDTKQIAEETIAAWTATQNPKGAAWVLIDTPTEPEPDPREAIEATYRATIQAGHCVAPEGFCLAMGDADRANWSQLLVLLREAEGLGAVDGSSLVDFLDITGTAQQATLTRFRQIIVGLGQAYQTAFFTRSAALAALQA